MKRAIRTWILGVGLAFLLTDIAGVTMPQLSFIADAQAVVGRPATPGSVAGVARRTTRRVIRRSTVYVSTLPAACVKTTVNGIVIWRCGGTYYQSYGGRYVVVYID
ncbi:hypothetical protein J2Z31_003527 [Sinorhizobium kostiense]|uniref:Transmembrane protein n=1 Tax=Sinorhizobium kostiense TaxID=76747 RepID=A0ABS4R269_9HYPH|nr:hypothetical protein [Sinorhizobium kostiense]MBP2237013.1 hypothetical protein [Sinorhizobium kostiense]